MSESKPRKRKSVDPAAGRVEGKEGKAHLSAGGGALAGGPAAGAETSELSAAGRSSTVPTSAQSPAVASVSLERVVHANPPVSGHPAMESSSAERELAVAREAYLLAERRGFAPGHELEDWLAAERAVARAS